MANIRIDELVDDFELLSDWESRFAYLIDLGKALPPMDEVDKCEENRVQGCQAQVWMKFEPEAEGKITIVADSDAFIVRGLIAVLLLIYSGKTAQEILNTDGQSVLERLGLAAHLSPTRKNGLFSMVKRVRELAEKEAANS
ncbi:MAG: cysteine desulfuration protein SufE [Dehalococcoidales bacterium]|nr:cysteine desulfuration protein SufE [Dehalococcoidales bacterium]MDP6034690.1 SufE family protein [Verrucomicrobiota bacterium]